MFTKKVSNLDYDDIVDLINNRKVGEGTHIDYKSQPNSSENFKKLLSKNISAFANSAGGYLILGVENDGSISGIEKECQNRPIIEWINQVISSNIEPRVYYHDPVPIFVPNSDKVIVVIHVPESSNKPHFSNELGSYFLRINDSSKPATHYQIRDMFDLTRNRTDDFNSFLESRNLNIEESMFFCENLNSLKLQSDFQDKLGLNKPIILFSYIPKTPFIERITIPISEMIVWIDNHCRGYQPIPNKSIYSVNADKEYKLDGIVLINNVYGIGLTSYVELLNSGFFEAGLSRSIFFPISSSLTETSTCGYVSLTGIIGYLLLLLGFSKKYLELANYDDEIFFQLSFKNVLNFSLDDFFGGSARSRYYGYYDGPKNSQHNNFKINEVFIPSRLDSQEIIRISKTFSEKICRVFGYSSDQCFQNDKINDDILWNLNI